MIYRIIGESVKYRWSDETESWERATGQLMGAYSADLAWNAWDDLPAPSVSNPRVRFWFTERGWQEYGRYVVAEARHTGRTFRLIRCKNPPRSAVVYRDPWQIALLPQKRQSDGIT